MNSKAGRSTHSCVFLNSVTHKCWYTKVWSSDSGARKPNADLSSTQCVCFFLVCLLRAACYGKSQDWCSTDSHARCEKVEKRAAFTINECFGQNVKRAVKFLCIFSLSNPMISAFHFMRSSVLVLDFHLSWKFSIFVLFIY